MPRTLIDTTRAPRAGEQDGREYYFTTKDDFLDLVNKNGFIEHAQFGGNYYGTSVKAVKDIAEKEKICILDIEMEVRSARETRRFVSVMSLAHRMLCLGCQASQTDRFKCSFRVPGATLSGGIGTETPWQRYRDLGEPEQEVDPSKERTAICKRARRP
jgi:hypothetical protein